MFCLLSHQLLLPVINYPSVQRCLSREKGNIEYKVAYRIQFKVDHQIQNEQGYFSNFCHLDCCKRCFQGSHWDVIEAIVPTSCHSDWLSFQWRDAWPWLSALCTECSGLIGSLRNEAKVWCRCWGQATVHAQWYRPQWTPRKLHVNSTGLHPLEPSGTNQTFHFLHLTATRSFYSLSLESSIRMCRLAQNDA